MARGTRRMLSSMVSSVRTGLTARLWQQRWDMQKYKQNASKMQHAFPPKRPKDSFLRAELKVRSDELVRDQYLNFRGGLRFALLLEDIDAFAGNIAFMHCNDGDPETIVPTLVTASLDRLDIHDPITLNLGQDFVLEGNVSWAGRTSLQIDVSLFPKSELDVSNSEHKLRCSMVFVCVDQKGKAFPINPLILETPQDEKRFNEGERANLVRKEERKRSLKVSPPTEEEAKILHRAMTVPDGIPDGLPMAAVRMQSVTIMQPQACSTSCI
ncbi:hypothetical protein GUITHDRAFT_106612 [Guillardia theta CCMP2712]|uniref:HotDog ACOT-type domain-containing protein n=1 Tax=Guillardia theta (strain CCMP2712) TaxID=905079 RepID=L1JHJ9_GUITC|nr:hypothetical protein GUITHDRAFT_106612 [Guillardia theta CCMP2712]EKX47624.1 hypothetical protein GUITHDRAFT_106612 [Guillardia theta CCMP2712]|eukprot:XP_005834604.1 hypothetical protein GUITHDRAFT_106612 [Guillardia theta CCMP2712]